MPHRRSWHSSPPLLSPPLLIILFPILTITLLFLAVPPLLTAATRLLRLASVKTSLDSFNILLVVFAILCGVFARRNDDEDTPPHNHVHDPDAVADRNAAFRRVPSEGQSQWDGFSEERKVYGNDTPLPGLQSPATGFTRSRMRRNSNSYPDLRQWETDDDRYNFRFFDDFQIDKQFRSPAREFFPAVDHHKRLPGSPPQQQEAQEDQVKEIPVDTMEICPSPPPVKSTTPPPPPPPSESSRRNTRRTPRKKEREREITVELDDREFTSFRSPPANSTTPPPPPPPPPSESFRHNTRRNHRKKERERESEITVELADREFTRIRSPPLAPPTPPIPSVKTRSEQTSDRKKSNVKREIAMVWASVLSSKKKKKKKQRTKNNDHYDDNTDELTNNATIPPPTPPPPPPPPPPPSAFHSFFRKGIGKSKKIHSVSVPPPPPPPPPQPPQRLSTGRPPRPNRTVTFNDEALNAGNQSPLIPIAPPLPPFKMKAMKFVVRGDYVKIRSNQSSRCSSPEREDINLLETPIVNENVTEAVKNTVTDRHGGAGATVFCPSPDVNVKAATFIASLRREWRLEKLNSLKEKGNTPLPPRSF